ncbi:hypothetical protein [Brevundimonas sp.]|uniref:hypothetical protein n=1 Tax=Brevundimonas sp. TaxID=1871086 RepID=UPI0025DE20A6|nr:hypothetical protein [Brevundimonas sp.]
MRKQAIGAASVAILATVALAACNFGSEKKDDATASDGGSDAAEASGEASSGGKPASGGSQGADAAETSDTGGAEAASGAKPEDGAGSGGGAQGSSGGQGASSGGGSGGVQSVGQVPAEFANLMTQYLDHYVENFGQGFSRYGQADVVTALQAGSDYRWNVNLEGGRTYRFFGACDNDCNDVDIIVEDANGREIASDVLTDDYPVVTIAPSASGRYTARILLVNCTVEPCFVGGRVLRQ